MQTLSPRSTTDAAATAPAPLPLSTVRIEDPFWSPRLETTRTTTLRQQEQKLRTEGPFRALERAADVLAGTATAGTSGGARATETTGASAVDEAAEPDPHPFWESDIAKWIEAGSYSLLTHPDPELETVLDRAITLLAGAQAEDGYLNTYITVAAPERRFKDLRDGHELYCLGHLIEAGVAHHQATGRTNLLDVVRRYADLVGRELAPGGAIEGGYCGHEEIELALVKLAAETGEARYLDMARTMIDNRGTRPFYFDAETERRADDGYFGNVFPRRPQQAERFRQYNQSHLPVREQDEAVGHSVRAMYLYSAMTDLALADEDTELLAACERLWTSVTEQKMYVTGGIGSDPSIEGFGPAFELPNDHNYNETCASIGLVMWARRLARTTGDGRYLDVLEQALLNTVLAGVSARGTEYFYGNPMESDGGHERQAWFGCACCPPNLARVLTSLGQYAFSWQADTAFVDMPVSGEVAFPLERGTTRVQVTSEYPYGGRVQVTPLDPGEFTVAVHIPEWAAGTGTPTLTVNGEAIAVEVTGNYVRVTRAWASGDELVLDLPLEVRRLHADPRVEADRGLVALARGPLVYCAEGADNPDVDLATVSLDPEADVRVEDDGYLGAPVLVTTVRTTEGNEVPLRLIPYFTWGNRGPSTMRVWLREEPAAD
jgi:DUF1680 family protein